MYSRHKEEKVVSQWWSRWSNYHWNQYFPVTPTNIRKTEITPSLWASNSGKCHDAPNSSPSTTALSCRGADLSVKGLGERKSSEAEDKGKREKRHAAADRAEKKWNGNYEWDNGGGGRMPSLIQADRKYSALAVVAIATRLALRDPGK